MFSDEITSTDAFLDMPKSSQLLYFHLGMNADDDGFIGSPKMIMRTLGSNDDDYKILIGKKFVIIFDSGICVIKHWRINNNIRKDIYKETKYSNERGILFIRENGAYSLNSTNAVVLPKGHFTVEKALEIKDNLTSTSRTRHVALGKVRIGKNRLDKDREDNTAFLQFWTSYPKRENKKGCEEKWKSKKLDSMVTEILSFIEKAKESDRWKKGFIKAPLVFLNQESWNDDIDAYNDIKKQSGSIDLRTKK